MDEDDYDDAVIVRIIPARQVSVLDFVIVGLDHIESLVESVTTLLRQHANYKVHRRQVENEMRAEIEFITSGGE